MPYWAITAACTFYALMAVVVWHDIKTENAGTPPWLPRPNAALLGVFWLPLALAGFAKLAVDLIHEAGVVLTSRR